MPYIQVPQHHAARVSVTTPPDINGLYTAGVLTCIVILLFIPDGSKISMIHADPTVSWEKIAAEIEWVGQHCEKFIIKTVKDITSQNIMTPEQMSIFKIIAAPANFWGLSISRAGCTINNYLLVAPKVAVCLETKTIGEPNFLSYPRKLAIDVVHGFNFFCDSLQRRIGREESAPLSYNLIIYDGNHWIEPEAQEFKLTAIAKKIYENLKHLTPHSPIPEIKNSLFRLFISGIFVNLDRKLMMSQIDHLAQNLHNTQFFDLKNLFEQGKIPELLQ